MHAACIKVTPLPYRTAGVYWVPAFAGMTNAQIETPCPAGMTAEAGMTSGPQQVLGDAGANTTYEMRPHVTPLQDFLTGLLPIREELGEAFVGERMGGELA
jgi:hypothetical protein